MNLGWVKSLGLVERRRKTRAGVRKRMVWWLVKERPKVNESKYQSFKFLGFSKIFKEMRIIKATNRLFRGKTSATRE